MSDWEDIESLFRAAYIRTNCTDPEKLDILLRARPGICGIKEDAGLADYPMVPSTGLFVFFSEAFVPGGNFSPLCLLQTHRQRNGHREEFYLTLQYTGTAPQPAVTAVFSVRKWRDNEQYCLAGKQLWEPAPPVTDPVDPKAPDYIWEEMCRGTGSKNLIDVLRFSGGPRLTPEILMQALAKYSEPVEFLNRAGGCGRFLFLEKQNDSAGLLQEEPEAEAEVERVLTIIPAQMGWAGMGFLYEGPGRYRAAVLARFVSDDWDYTDFFCRTGQMVTLPEMEAFLRSYRTDALDIRFGRHEQFAPDYPIAGNIRRALDDLHVFCESDDPAVRAAACAFSGILRMIPEEWSQERLESGFSWDW